jgi:hypothetical protein
VRPTIRALAGLAAVALAGCGATNGGGAPASTADSIPASPAGGNPATSPARPAALSQLGAAAHPSRTDFPSARGRSLGQLASLARSAAQLGAATGTFTPGWRRFAFALTSRTQGFIYAPTALYIASSPTAPVRGPFLAPADSMVVPPQDRSQQNSAPGGLLAIYWTELPVPRPGVYDLLALTRANSSLIGARGEVAVAPSSPIPDVGQRPPDIATDTLASVHGRLGLLTTRIPPESMHSVSLHAALGSEPVALLFSTPQLCTSRVCGPVTDVTVTLEHEFASRIAFIHQEVYVGNQPTRGLRPQLKAFHLETEPWLFAINRRGVIVARLEGAFGIDELRHALKAALG